MPKIKSNPHVYPYTPFYNLSVKSFSAKFLPPLVLSSKQIKAILNKQVLPHIIVDRNKKKSEQILDLFSSPVIRFGPLSFITGSKGYWLNKFNGFINRNQPLRFTILGFPFKIPVPLKTDRTMPDFGELLSLHHLNAICTAIEKIYSPGAKITIFAEGAFGKFNYTSPDEYHRYKKTLDKMIRTFDLKHLEVHNLDEMEMLDRRFSHTLRHKIAAIKTLYLKGDQNIVAKYLGATESIYRIVNTKRLKLTDSDLMDVYNDKITSKFASTPVTKTRNYIQKKLPVLIFNYIAYLTLRDDLNFLEKAVPGGVSLTVSPKKLRLGIYPISSEVIRLPYHGIPVYHAKTRNFSIEYLVDIKRRNHSVTPVYWKSDNEKLPFFYKV